VASLPVVGVVHETSRAGRRQVAAVFELGQVAVLPGDEFAGAAEVAAGGLAVGRVDDQAVARLVWVGWVDDLVAARTDVEQVAVDDGVGGGAAAREPGRERSLVLAPARFTLTPLEITGAEPFLLGARLLVAFGFPLESVPAVFVDELAGGELAAAPS
jgi:hypothetical protein